MNYSYIIMVAVLCALLFVAFVFLFGAFGYIIEVTDPINWNITKTAVEIPSQ